MTQGNFYWCFEDAPPEENTHSETEWGVGIVESGRLKVPCVPPGLGRAGTPSRATFGGGDRIVGVEEPVVNRVRALPCNQ